MSRRRHPTATRTRNSHRRARQAPRGARTARREAIRKSYSQGQCAQSRSNVVLITSCTPRVTTRVVTLPHTCRGRAGRGQQLTDSAVARDRAPRLYMKQQGLPDSEEVSLGRTPYTILCQVDISMLGNDLCGEGVTGVVARRHLHEVERPPRCLDAHSVAWPRIGGHVE